MPKDNVSIAYINISHYLLYRVTVRVRVRVRVRVSVSVRVGVRVRVRGLVLG